MSKNKSVNIIIAGSDIQIGSKLLVKNTDKSIDSSVDKQIDSLNILTRPTIKITQNGGIIKNDVIKRTKAINIKNRNKKNNDVKSENQIQRYSKKKTKKKSPSKKRTKKQNK